MILRTHSSGPRRPLAMRERMQQYAAFIRAWSSNICPIFKICHSASIVDISCVTSSCDASVGGVMWWRSFLSSDTFNVKVHQNSIRRSTIYGDVCSNSASKTCRCVRNGSCVHDDVNLHVVHAAVALSRWSAWRIHRL